MSNSKSTEELLVEILSDLIYDTTNSYGYPPDYEPDFDKAKQQILKHFVPREEVERAKVEAQKNQNNDSELVQKLSTIITVLSEKFVYDTSDDYKKAKTETKNTILALLQDEILKAQTNAVAWSVGVVDQLHFGDPADADKIYKGIKNTIRYKYEEVVGVDPAPSYPIESTLNTQTEEELCEIQSKS